MGRSRTCAGTMSAIARRSANFVVSSVSLSAVGIDEADSEHLDVEERHPQLERVGHRHLVGLDQDVAAQPGEQVDVLHPGRAVEVLGRGVQLAGHVHVGHVGVVGLQQPVRQFFGPEDPGVAVVALLDADRAAAQHVLAAQPFGQPGRQGADAALHRAGQVVERAQRDRLAVDRVAAEQLVGALARQHHLDVLAGLAGDEVQRDERGIGDRIVEVPDDQRQRRPSSRRR